MRKFLSFVVLGVGLSLVGCTQNPQPLGKPLPQLTYENLQPLTPWQGAVNIRQSFRPDVRAIEAAKEFKTPPDVLLQRYAGHRFMTEGRPVKLVFDIRDATVIKKTDEENLIGFLSGASKDTYVLTYAIRMLPVDENGAEKDPFIINMKRELFIPHRSSLSDREYLQFEFLENAIHDIDKIVSEMVNTRMR